MSLSSQESACQKINELRQRLDKVRAFWETPKSRNPTPGWRSFREDWQQGWKGIVATFAEIDRMLNRSLFPGDWETRHPAILQFPPAEEG